MREKDDLDLLLDSALSTYADPGTRCGLEDRVLAALSATRASGERPTVLAWPRRRRLPWAIAIPVAVCLVLWIATARIKHAPSNRPEQAYRLHRMQAPSAGAPMAAEPHPATPRKMRPSGAEAHADLARLAARLKPCPFKTPSSYEPCKAPGDCGATSAPLDLAQGRLRKPCPVTKLASEAASASLPKLDVFPTPQPLSSQERSLAAVAWQTSLPVREALVQAQSEDEVPIRIAAIHIPPLEPPDPGQP